jgi:hypothetical protein
MVQELLSNIVNENLIKIIKKKEIDVDYWYCWKALNERDFFGDDFIISRPMVWEILNFE